MPSTRKDVPIVFRLVHKNVYETTSARTGERYTCVRYPDQEFVDNGPHGAGRFKLPYASCTCPGLRNHGHCKHEHALCEQHAYEELTQDEIAQLFGMRPERVEPPIIFDDPFEGLT